jgi:hypothetical protein
MTDGLDQALAGVAFTLLAADAITPALVVYDGVVAAGAVPPYLLVYTTVDRPDSDVDLSLHGRSNVWVTRWILHCVGRTASSARAIAQRARTQLLDVVPVIPGLACGPIRAEPTAPPVRDESLGDPVMDLVAVYRLRATS